MAKDKEVAVPESEPITQENLPEALEDGRITQEEIDHIWRETEYLSAQTPIEVRKAIVALIDAGHAVTPINQILLQTVMDLRAALYRDEAKFSHLVAGTETIVDKLQAINQWEMLVESLKTRLDETNLLVAKLVRQGEEQRQRNDRMRRALHILMQEDVPDVADDPDDSDPYGPGAKPINFDDGPYIAEPEPEEEVDRKIGSNWDKANPRKR